MMKAVDGWEFNNVAGLRCSYGTTVRRVAVQGLVCSPRMVVIQIRRHESLEMPVVGKHDENEQHPKSNSRDDEKVDRNEISNMLV
jgi:hypothetical protein